MSSELQHTARSPYLIPGAIVIAGIIIAGALVYTSGGLKGGFHKPAGSERVAGSHEAEQTIRPIDETDPIRGNPDAAITIVEYSDFECPFCAQAHPTLTRLTEEFPDVRWVYRHFPLTSIHSRAQTAAIASECVQKLGGSAAFWHFSDTLFENQRQLGSALYERTAVDLGLDKDSFAACLTDDSIRAAVNADLNEAVALGGRGTPFSIVITSSGALMPVSGALPYETFVSVIQEARAN